MDSSPTRIVERLLEDDYVHEQLGAAASQLSGAYHRVRRQPARDAVADQKIVDRLRGAAEALEHAARRTFGEPEPEPKRGRRWLASLAILLGVGWVARAMDRAQRQGG
jgi:hypothetical protein